MFNVYALFLEEVFHILRCIVVKQIASRVSFALFGLNILAEDHSFIDRDATLTYCLVFNLYADAKSLSFSHFSTAFSMLGLFV